jgi:hypothetical protein
MALIGGFILVIDQYKIPKGKNKHIVKQKNMKGNKNLSQKHRKINIGNMLFWGICKNPSEYIYI